MPALRELRYDRLTLSPRPMHAALPRGSLRDPFRDLLPPGTSRDPFDPRNLFPPAPFLGRQRRSRPVRSAQRGARRDDHSASGAAAAVEYGDETPTESEDEGIVEEFFSDDDPDFAREEDEAAAYVVGPDSIRFLPPVDNGSLVVFDRRLGEVHAPSPRPWSDWPSRPEPWQTFYTDRGGGAWLRVLPEDDLNEELWIAFLLDRGAGRHAPWWMDLERAFQHCSSVGHDDDVPQGAAKRQCLRAAEDVPAAGDEAAGAAPDVHPLINERTEDGEEHLVAPN